MASLNDGKKEDTLTRKHASRAAIIYSISEEDGSIIERATETSQELFPIAGQKVEASGHSRKASKTPSLTVMPVSDLIEAKVSAHPGRYSGIKPQRGCNGSHSGSQS